MADAAHSPELMLGTLALKAGYITRKQLEECLKMQQAARAKGQSMPLGQLLVRKKYIKEKSLLFLLQNHEYVDQRADDKLFGQIAIANGLLAQKDLDACLDAQRNLYFDRRLVKQIGQLLLEKRLLTAQEVEAIRTAQDRMRGGIARSPAEAPGPKIEWETAEMEIPEAPEIPAPPPPPARPERPSLTRLRRPGSPPPRRK